jgi:hypothetical protein
LEYVLGSASTAQLAGEAVDLISVSPVRLAESVGCAAGDGDNECHVAELGNIARSSPWASIAHEARPAAAQRIKETCSWFSPLQPRSARGSSMAIASFLGVTPRKSACPSRG